jgi:hypothetical protein
MLLTVAIPTYKRPDMLGQCIDSLLPQLTEDVEILVVDNDPDGSARASIEGRGNTRLRYVNETAPGVVQARNRAVRESAGRYLAFIDDDEIARPGWIDAIKRHAGMGVAASFGIVTPTYKGAVALGIEAMADNLYTRDLKQPQDADISARWIKTGTGNSLFDKAVCFPRPNPFSAHLNGTGGEDVWLMKSLVERGLTLRWNPAAVVEEQVPADRATLAYVSSRRYRQGQQRIVLMRGGGGVSGLAKTALWMSVGAAQFGLHSGQAIALRAIGRPAWRAQIAKASGGLGKVLWWRLWNANPYAGGGGG